MDDCIFCKINDGTIPSNKLYQNDWAFLIKDVNPIAPHHVLVITKHHFDSINHPLGFHHHGMMPPEWASNLFSSMLELLYQYAIAHKLDETGYRIVINTGKDAGQTVQHFHMHLIGGAELKGDFGAS